MLKKYINKVNAPYVFLKFALALIMCYSVAVTMYLSMPPASGHTYEVFRNGVLLMEYIMMSCCIAAVFFDFILYVGTYKIR